MSYIHSLRQHPEHKKKRIALLASGVITALIVVIWIATLPARFSQTAAVGDAANSIQPVPSNSIEPEVYTSSTDEVSNVSAYSSNGVVITDSTTTTKLNSSF